MASATHDNETVPIYAGHIDISGTFGVNVLRAYGGNLASQGLIALIGRDVLQQGVLVFNGADGTYSFSI